MVPGVMNANQCPAQASYRAGYPMTIAPFILAMRKHIAQRSGIDPRNYRSSWADKAGQAAFMADYRAILHHGRDARKMLAKVESINDLHPDALARGLSAISGRLSFDGTKLEYCTGQYFPTEYRAAACAVLAGILIHHW